MLFRSEEVTEAKNEVAEEIAVPSEEKVQEMTEELIKQRESEEILKEAIKNSKLENRIGPAQSWPSHEGTGLIRPDSVKQIRIIKTLLSRL